MLMNYSWPGNIRQLENAIEHAVAMTGQEREIPARALPDDILQPASSLLLPTVAIPDEGINFTSVVSQLERELILRCLEKTGGNKRQAARLLQLEPHDADRQAASPQHRMHRRIVGTGRQLRSIHIAVHAKGSSITNVAPGAFVREPQVACHAPARATGSRADPDRRRDRSSAS